MDDNLIKNIENACTELALDNGITSSQIIALLNVAMLKGYQMRCLQEDQDSLAEWRGYLGLE